MFSSLGQAPLAHVSPDMSPALSASNPAWWEGTVGIQFWRGPWDSSTLCHHSCLDEDAQPLFLSCRGRDATCGDISWGWLSRWVLSVLCASFLLQPDCLRHTAPEGGMCLNPVPFGLVQPGRGSGLGQGLCSEAGSGRNVSAHSTRVAPFHRPRHADVWSVWVCCHSSEATELGGFELWP